MRSLRFYTGVLVASAILTAMGNAQEVPSIGSLGKTDVAVSLYGAFSPTVSDSSGNAESPSNAAGAMFELRHLANPVLGFEGTYSFNHADQTYQYAVACPVGQLPCLPLTEVVRANAHEVSVDWIPSVHIANVRPFGVLGLGALLHVPASGQDGTQTSTRAVYIYGAGLDWGLLPHIGLRVQYRGNLYNAPQLTIFNSPDKFIHTSEPMIGAYFRL